MAIPTSGLLGWWRVSDLAPVADGTRITSIPDQSGNGNNLALYGSQLGPKYYANMINGHPAAFFDNVSSDGIASETIDMGRNNVTMIAVIRPNTATGNHSIFDGSGTGGVGIRQSGTGVAMVVRAVLASTVVATGNLSVNTPALVTADWDSVNNRGFINGTISNTNSYTPAITGSRFLLVGAGTSNFSGYMAEWWIYDHKLSDADRAQVHSYVQDKYGISVSDYVPPVYRMDVWDGSSWAKRPAKVWTGSQWKESQPKVWDGSSWILPE